VRDIDRFRKVSMLSRTAAARIKCLVVDIPADRRTKNTMYELVINSIPIFKSL